MANVHLLFETANALDESEPPYNVDAELAELKIRLQTNTWTDAETAWLDKMFPILDSGVIDFKANDWYSLAYELAQKGLYPDLWIMCCQDIQFTFPDPFTAPVKCSDPYTIRDLATSWYYSHLENGSVTVAPHWDETEQCLKTQPYRNAFTMEHLLSVIEAFATSDVVANIRRGLIISDNLGGYKPPQRLNDYGEICRYTSWLLSPEIVGGPAKSNDLVLPSLEVQAI